MAFAPLRSAVLVQTLSQVEVDISLGDDLVRFARQDRKARRETKDFTP
jgi:hypothetical protein